MATTWTDETIELGRLPAARARVYRPVRTQGPAPVVLHLHGGAFIAGSLNASRVIPTLLAEAGAVVVSLDYPLAPQHRFPHALHAGYGALQWLHRTRARWGGKKSHLFVAGEEAGGNLAAALALMARDQHTPPLAGQILLSPMLDPRMATCSMRQAEAGPVGCRWADGWHEYLGSADKASHPYAAPLGASRLSGLAPALVITAQDDLLRDESLSYARRLGAAGVPVDEHVLPGPTGWPCAFSDPDAAGAAWTGAVRERFAAFLARHLSVVRPSSLQPA
jgi:acetyl esterase/lipase